MERIAVRIQDGIAHCATISTKDGYFSVINENGADREGILQGFPELRPLVDLHLSKLDGIPAYALEDGFYHYAEGVDEGGNRVFHASEDAKKAEEQARQDAAFMEFVREFDTLPLVELQDIWESVIAYKWTTTEYKSELFQRAKCYKQGYKSALTELVVQRNNKHLASHLRIPLDEAAAIPPDLTKEQFNAMYILPNIARWKGEAETALTWIKSMDDDIPAEVDDKVRYYTPEKYAEWRTLAY